MPLGETPPKRMTSAERRAWRLKKTGSAVRKTGTNRTVGSVVMGVTPNNAYPQSASAAPKKKKVVIKRKR